MDTFPIVRRKDEAKFTLADGTPDYRTKRRILEIYDEMQRIASSEERVASREVEEAKDGIRVASREMKEAKDGIRVASSEMKEANATLAAAGKEPTGSYQTKLNPPTGGCGRQLHPDVRLEPG